MRKQISIGISLTLMALVYVALMVSCDTESATENNVRITPDTVRLDKGQSQQFTASGGYEYTWSLDGGTGVDEWGQLSTTHGPTTVYTSSKNASTAGTFRVIHVKSTIPGSASGSTTTTPGTNSTTTTTTGYSMTSDAFVEHAVDYGALNVTPSAVTGFKYGSFQTFTASGGDGTYSWTLQDRGLGELSSDTGATTTYSSLSRAMDSNTVNRLHVASGDGQSFNVVIYHADESTTSGVSTLAISPATATVALNGTASFTASGGDGFYTWTLDSAAHGQLSFASADTATYLCTSVDSTNTIVVTLTLASNGESRQATILHTPSAINNLSVSPSSASVTNSQSVTFTASGGELPYVWTPDSSTYGTLTTPSATQATYTRNYAGVEAVTIIITVQSADGQTVQTQVNHRN